MDHAIARARGLGYIAWQSRHMAYHVMIGLLWAWFLRERWGEFNPKWIWTAVIGSVLPDIDHLNYFFGYGRKESYTKTIAAYIRKHEWRNLFQFVSAGHKHNTNLSYHNIYVMVLFAVAAVLFSFIDWQAGVVLCGAMASHYLFDIADDMIQLGYVNANWGRWGRKR